MRNTVMMTRMVHAEDWSGKKDRPLRICRRATYSYVLIGGAVAKNKSTQDKSRAGEKISECRE
jgi:hypothetical protein